MNTKTFLETKLGGLLDGLRTARVTATTKNDIGNLWTYKNGSIKDIPEGLSIRAFQGVDVIAPEIAKALFLINAAGTEPYSRGRMRAICETNDFIDGQKYRRVIADAMSSSSDNKTEEVFDKNFLISYVGLHGLMECVNALKSVKETDPEIQIIITACDCGRSQKEEIFQDLFDKKIIVDFTIDRDCGGLKSMADFLDGFVEKWPLRQI